MANESEFYLLWMENGKSPTIIHSTHNDAKIEAERLAVNFPGRKIFIVKAIEFCVSLNIQWVDLDDIPF